MSNICIDVAVIGVGHETKEYNSQDKDSLEKMIEFVQKKLKEGFQLHSSQDGDDYVKAFAQKNASMAKIKAELEKSDRLMLKEEVKELVLLPPVHGG
jgi:hypothetical protein